MYGITGVPSLVLFHNGKPIAKYNGSDYSLYEFTKFVIRHTGKQNKFSLNYLSTWLCLQITIQHHNKTLNNKVY